MVDVFSIDIASECLALATEIVRTLTMAIGFATFEVSDESFGSQLAHGYQFYKEQVALGIKVLEIGFGFLRFSPFDVCIFT